MPAFRSSGTSDWTRTRRSTRRTSRTTSSKSAAAGYSTLCTTFQQQISSLRTLCNQATGTASSRRPSPATLYAFSRWITKGAVIHRVSSSQLKRWSGTSRTFTSPTTAKSVLQKRFGKGTIKAVTTDKSGSFLVATSATRKGKKFSFPH